MQEASINQHTGESHGSVMSYVGGLVISLLLTLAAFGVVMAGGMGLSRSVLMAVIAVCAVAQILVQLVCFMHMGSSDMWWNRVSFIFTAITIAILVGGSLWVMYHLHANMHPDGMNHDTQQNVISVPAAASAH